jgi:hypothetical protein
MNEQADDTEIYTGKGGRRPGAGAPKGNNNKNGGILGGEGTKANLLIRNARAKKEMYLANMAELEFKARQRELISLAECHNVIDIAATACREHLMGIPGRFASIFASESDPMQIERDMESEIRQALEHIADAISKFRDGA